MVLGADEQQGRDVARALEPFTDRDRSAIVEHVATDQVRLPGAWSAALDHLEAADVVVVVVTDRTVADVAWCRLVVHAVTWRTGIVALVADATPLNRWPFGLRDAMPPTIDVREHAWPAELANIVRELEPSRPDPSIQPPRPEPPFIEDPDSESPTSDGIRHEHVGGFPDLDNAPSDDVEPLDESVQFTVYRPTAVRSTVGTGCSCSPTPPRADADIPDPLAEVRARRRPCSATRPPSTARCPLTALVLFAVAARSWSSRGWTGRRSTRPRSRCAGRSRCIGPTSASASARTRPAIARGGVRIFVGAVLVGELNLAIRVGEGGAPHQARTSVRRFRKVFASYSHADAEVVEAVASTVRFSATST